ncbi:MAG: 50S ribosomal protein L35 [Dehalococcoidales bacterium]|nr:50S ribosomal protein L35 [Dehalococcoidales bacterium]
MPKLKNHRGTKKRFRITGSGKIMRMHQGNTHFRRRKARRVKALFDGMQPLHAADQRRISRLMPYPA